MKKTVYIYDYIDAKEGINFAGLAPMIKQAEAEGMELCLKINSGGGQLTEAMKLYELISSYQGKTVAEVHGVCASAATLLLLAAKERKATIYSMLMIHLPMGTVNGNSDDMKRKAEVMEQMNERVKDLYMSRMRGLTREDLSTMLAKESYLTPNEAVEYGLIDSVIPFDATTYQAEAVEMAEVMMSLKSQTQTKAPDMSKELETQVADLKAKNAELLAALEAAHKKQIDNVLATAMSDKRIKEADKPKWEALMKADFDHAVAVLSDLPKGTDTKTETNPEKIETKGGKTDERADWTIRDWEMKDSAGLLNMKRTEPEKFNELFNDFYKK